MPLRTILPLLLVLLGRAIAAPSPTVVDGVAYQVVRAAPRAVSILWVDKRGVPLRTFPAAARYLLEEGTPAETLMNGGIFEPGGQPSGLLIQDGTEWRPVNRRTGDGNFFLQPNGIFLLGTAGAAIIPTGDHPLTGMNIRCAVQSGPLLLRAGSIHPQLSKDSASRLHRNGVGVDKSGAVVLVSTDPASPKLPNLHEFAQLFRSLDCPDALFLDGIISQMRSGADIGTPSPSFGPIIAVTRQARQPATADRPAPEPPADTAVAPPPPTTPPPPP